MVVGVGVGLCGCWVCGYVIRLPKVVDVVNTTSVYFRYRALWYYQTIMSLFFLLMPKAPGAMRFEITKAF